MIKAFFVVLALLGVFLLCGWIGLAPLYMGGAMAATSLLAMAKL